MTEAAGVAIEAAAAATEAGGGYGRSFAGLRTPPDGWRARLLAHARTVVVVCGLAAIPFAADLVSEMHAHGAAARAEPAHSAAAVAPPLPARVSPRP